MKSKSKTMFVLLVIALLLAACGPPDPTKCLPETLVYERGVHSLSDALTGKATFGILSVGTNEALELNYNEVLENGAIFQRTLKQGTFMLFEDATEDTARVQYKSPECDVDVALTSKHCQELCGVPAESITSIDWYEIHVPPGTVMQVFKVDSK